MSTKISQGKLEATILASIEHFDDHQGVSIDAVGGSRRDRHRRCSHHERHKSGECLDDIAGGVTMLDRHTTEMTLRLKG